jgi:hypothetical protein
MTTDKRIPVEVWIVLSESGASVVAADQVSADDLADHEFEEDEDRRYLHITVKMLPADREIFRSFEVIEPDEA